MLDAHLIDWRARAETAEIVEPGRWLGWSLDTDRASPRVLTIRREPVGLVGYSAVVDGRRHAFYPLDAAAVRTLTDTLRDAGGTGFATSRDLDWLRPAGGGDSAQ
jgi:hypothetical protein